MSYRVFTGRCFFFFFFQAEDGIRDVAVTGVQKCALPISMLDPRVPPTLREGEHIPRSSTRSRQTPPCLTVRAEAWARRCCLKSPKGHGFRCLSMDLGVLDECAWRSR